MITSTPIKRVFKRVQDLLTKDRFSDEILNLLEDTISSEVKTIFLEYPYVSLLDLRNIRMLLYQKRYLGLFVILLFQMIACIV